MTPVFLVGMGRSGTTYLMRVLASHPQLIAYEDYPLEFRVALFSFYPCHPVIRSSTVDGHWRFQNDTELLHTPLQLRGRLNYGQVQAIYQALAGAANKRPRYFVEKCPVGVDLAVARQIVPDLRPVCLVRDPRDLLLSVRAFDRRRGFHGFREQAGDTDEHVVVKYKRVFEKLGVTVATTKDRYLIRYEDAVLSPERSLGSLLDWLEIDAEPNTVRACIARAMALEDGRHVTADSIENSIGRWRKEMSPQLQELFARHFEQILIQYGYPLN